VFPSDGESAPLLSFDTPMTGASSEDVVEESMDRPVVSNGDTLGKGLADVLE
jgi:hypothetical protein